MGNMTVRSRVGRMLGVLPYFRRRQAAQRWVEEDYTPFARAERRRIFMSIARFAHINRPIDGYYFEFGSHEGNTMRMAWDAFQHLFGWTFVAFDSFQGLPPMESHDRSDIFRAGNLATSEQRFVQIVTGHGMPRERLMTIPGFYDDTLTDDLRRRLLPKKAAVIYVDCDLYKSTVPVLRFIVPFLQKGTIVVFDDWNCYHGDPALGERRAWSEFRNVHPELKFEPFVSTGEAQAFICTDSGQTAVVS
jgi:O-methyltransferase